MKNDVVYSLLVTSIKSSIKNLRESLTTENSLSPSSVPLSFLTQEQKEHFDLQKFEDYQSDTQFFTQPTNQYFAENHSSLAVDKINSRFMLIRTSEFYILDVKQFITFFLISNFENTNHIEDTSIPLLISEPFKVPTSKIDAQFNNLKKIGFEFDRLNAEYIVLRTIPKFIPQNLVNIIAAALIELASTKTLNYTQMRTHKNDLLPLINLNSDIEILPSLIEKYLNDEENNSFMIQLNDQNILTLFKA